MRIPHLVAALVATALAGTPVTAVAESAPTTHPISTPKAAPTVATDVEQYAAREAKDKKAASFQGGGEVVVIGASTMTLLLVILILVIVF